MKSENELLSNIHWITIKHRDKDQERQNITCFVCETLNCSFIVVVSTDDDEGMAEMPMCCKCTFRLAPENPRRIIALEMVDLLPIRH